MKQLFLSFAVILAAAVSLTSCMDDKGPNTVYYTNIVTFQKNIPSYMVFEYQKINDSPLIELQARGQMDTKALPEGGRCLITYSYAAAPLLWGHHHFCSHCLKSPSSHVLSSGVHPI